MATVKMLGLFGILCCSAQGGTDRHPPFQGEPDVRVAGVRRATGLTAADFDGDGKRDLVMLSGLTAEMAVLLNQGGSFESTRPKLVDAGTSASGLSVDDFNEDGQVDVAVCHHDTDEIWLLMGRGDGTFEAAKKFRVPVIKPHVHRIVSVDLNHDHHSDLLLAQSEDNRVWAYLGDGKGGFAPSEGSPYPTGNHPYVVAAGDFNGDGHVDFATPNWYGKSVSVFLGDGTGKFQVAPKSPLTGFKAPVALAAGDLTGDKLIDIALGSDDSSEVQILTGDGAGAFAVGEVPTLQAQAECFAPILEDLNQDGRIDVIANAQNGAKTLSYWINLGGARFGSAHALPCPGSATTLCVADLNDDGVPDLAVGADDSDGTLIWFGKRR